MSGELSPEELLAKAKRLRAELLKKMEEAGFPEHFGGLGMGLLGLSATISDLTVEIAERAPQPTT